MHLPKTLEETRSEANDMNKNETYLTKRKELIRELIRIETQRKAINKKWRETIAEAKALDTYLISDEATP